MVTSAASVEWTVVNTEVEALQLEYSWIKEYDPRFNVKYRDDKSYPWLAVTLNEEFPRVMVGRGRQEARGPLLRPLLPRLGDPGDRRPAAAGVPDALVHQRRLQAIRADRPAVPARLHREVRGALRRAGRRRGAPGDRRRLLRLHGRPDHGVREAAREGDVRRLGRDRLRARRQAARRHRRAQPGDGEAAGGAGRRHRRRRGGALGGPARGRGADLLRARRPDPRAARLGRGQGGRRGHRGAGRGLPAAAVRRRARRLDPAGGPGAGAARRHARARAVAQRPARGPGRDQGAPAR